MQVPISQQHSVVLEQSVATRLLRRSKSLVLVAYVSREGRVKARKSEREGEGVEVCYSLKLKVGKDSYEYITISFVYETKTEAQRHQ